jgi:predicted nucleotidyltransferase
MSNYLPLMDVLFPAARQRALAILLLRPTESYHLRALARLTGSHAGTLARELDKLTDAGLLRRSELGNQVRYQADRNHPLFDELASIFRKTHGAAALLRDALEPLKDRIQLACIFGSTAKGSDTGASDIDLLVVGDAGFAEIVQALYPAQQELQREINPVLYSADEFRDRSNRREPFLREILGKPTVWLIGDKDDLAELAGNPATAAAHGE